MCRKETEETRAGSVFRCIYIYNNILLIHKGNILVAEDAAFHDKRMKATDGRAISHTYAKLGFSKKNVQMFFSHLYA